MPRTTANLMSLINEVRELAADRLPDRLDPNGGTVNKLRAWIKGIDNADALRIIAAANVKWASSMALTELIIRGERAA